MLRGWRLGTKAQTIVEDKNIREFVAEKPKSFLEFVNGKVVKKLRS